MRDGFIKIAAATPDLHVADCEYNAAEIVNQAKQAAARGAKLITFPELCLTGYTCGDLFLQETLLEGALDALNTVCRETAELAAVIVVGLPLRVRGKLYNVAAVVNAGDVLAFVPKTHLPNYSEFYEQRHFVSADTLSGGMEGVDVKNADGEAICVPLVTDSIFQCDEQPLFTFGVEICEDLWVPNPPSTALAQMGAHIIVNLSASDEIIGKAGYRRDLVRQQSGRLLCAYLYADAGFGESTQDLVFAGHDLIAENGALLSESKMFSQGIIYADIDLQRLAHERQRMNTFESIEGGVFSFSLEPVENDTTFAENAMIKAKAVMQASGLPAIADDSGLCVDALSGAPGIYSARYGGLDDDKARYQLLLQNLRGAMTRAAHFHTSVVCCFPDGDVLTAEGECAGTIAYAPQGEGGFGYDPVFFVPQLRKTFA